MEIILPSQKLALLDYMQLLKYQLSEWLIIETKLVDQASQTMTVSSVAELLNELFAAYQGRILVCNKTEVLMLIEWGKDNSPQKLAKKIGEKLPPDVCETVVVPPTQKGLKKIELLLVPTTEEKGQMYKARVARSENIFLVADDDMYMRLLAKKGLQDLGTVIEAGEGKLVAEMYRTHNPDMVLLDIHMPDLTGQEVLAKLLEIDPHAYVVMLSADSSIENVQWAKQHGASGFLTKPFEKSKLLAYVENCGTTK